MERGRIGVAERPERRESKQKERSSTLGEKAAKVAEERLLEQPTEKGLLQKRPVSPGTMGMGCVAG